MLTGVVPLLGYASVPEDGVLPASQSTSQTENTPVDYSAKTDQELNVLLADWDTLREDEQRALLPEVKLRMIRSKDRGGVFRIRTERRYGRIVRRADGKVLRFETGVIRIQPVPKDQQGYGVGFEQRHAQREGSQPQTAPVLKAADPSR